MRILETLARVRTLLVASAVIIVVGMMTLAIEAPRPDGSIDTGLSDLVFRVLAPLSLLGWLAVLATYQICFYRRIESYESRDASQTPVAPTPRLYAQGATLLGLGFQPVGQLGFRWPWQKWKIAWVFTQPVERVDAVIGIGPLPALASHWADGSCLATTKGLRNRSVDLHDVRLVLTSGSIETVYARHVQQAVEFGQGRGERLPTESMVDFSAHGQTEVPFLRSTMRAVWLRPAPLLLIAFATLILLLLIVSELHLV